MRSSPAWLNICMTDSRGRTARWSEALSDAVAKARNIQLSADQILDAVAPSSPATASRPSADTTPLDEDTDPITVFITWAHSHRSWNRTQVEQWERSVAAFVTTLRQDGGLDADVDLYHLTDQDVDWTRFGQNGVRDADFTIIVMSLAWAERWSGTNGPTEGAGAAAEADTLHGLFNQDQRAWQKRLKLVQFPGSDGEIPPELERVPRYFVDPEDFDTYEDLIRTLTNQPIYQKPELAEVPTLPSSVVNRGRKSATQTEQSDTSSLVSELTEIRHQLNAGVTDPVELDRLTQRRSVLEAVLDALTKSD